MYTMSSHVTLAASLVPLQAYTQFCASRSYNCIVAWFHVNHHNVSHHLFVQMYGNYVAFSACGQLKLHEVSRVSQLSCYNPQFSFQNSCTLPQYLHLLVCPFSLSDLFFFGWRATFTDGDAHPSSSHICELDRSDARIFCNTLVNVKSSLRSNVSLILPSAIPKRILSLGIFRHNIIKITTDGELTQFRYVLVKCFACLLLSLIKLVSFKWHISSRLTVRL